MHHPQHRYFHNSVVICERSVRSANGGRNWCLHGTKFLDQESDLDCDLDNFATCKLGINLVACVKRPNDSEVI